jgi:hypothetical protein
LCGGLPDLVIINTALIGADPEAVSFIRHNVWSMHRFIGHVNQYLRPVNIQEFETALEHARVLHILNRTNEEKFKQSVFTIYNKKTKKSVNIRLLELVQTVGMDLLQNYIKIYAGIGHKPTELYVEKTKEIVKEFHTIIEYFNMLQEKLFNSLLTFVANNIPFGYKSLQKLLLLVPDLVEIKLNGLIME